MKKGLVAKCLIRYKQYKDWVEIYNDKLTKNMGVSYDGVRSKTNAINSDVENKVISRERLYLEYGNKMSYIKLVDKILGKLTIYERKVIKCKFNLVNSEQFKEYQPGNVPDVEIYSSDIFHYQRDKYYQIKKSAYNKISEFVEILELAVKQEK